MEQLSTWVHMCLFFFSSRRRHTRYWRDWSSDVCSSDLARRRRRMEAAERSARRSGAGGPARDRSAGRRPVAGTSAARSGERRGGEECRSRWSAYHLKKKKNSYYAMQVEYMKYSQSIINS